MHEFGGRYVFVRPDADTLSEQLQQVASGEVKVHIAERFGLDQTGEALAASKTGHIRGKVVVTI